MVLKIKWSLKNSEKLNTSYSTDMTVQVQSFSCVPSIQ